MTKGKLQTIAAGLYEALNVSPAGKHEAIMQNAFKMLERSRLLSRENEFLNILQGISDKEEGIVRAKVYSRYGLSAKEEDKIKDIIKRRTGKEHISIESIKKEDVIGGVRIEIGDTVIDTTLKSRLKQLSKHLTKN